MGVRGPVPKRTEALLTKGVSDVEKQARMDAQVRMNAPVVMPPAQEFWHPLARRWYESLGDSGQSRFYEPSDWRLAQLCAHVMTQYLGEPDKPSKPDSRLLGELNRMMTLLLTSEADRRRVRLEVARQTGASEAGGAAGVSALDTYRNRLRGAPQP